VAKAVQPHGGARSGLLVGNASIIFVAIAISLRRSVSLCLWYFLDPTHLQCFAR
jgi:hypothetical protein